jgi:multidrug efflux pump subunit AcrA (membrane-fusion protein)
MKNSIAHIYQSIKNFFWPLTIRRKMIRFVALVIIVVFAIVTLGKNDEGTESATTSLPPIVYVGTASDVMDGDDTSFVGTVRAVSEAQIQSELGGRVTAVNVKPGDTVQAGAIIATLENASEQATLLQAQGAYEAALANAAQSEVSVNDAQNTLLSAQNGAISAYRNAYTSVNTVVLNDIDIFFSDPTARTTPGVRIDSKGNTVFLNSARVQLQSTLSAWQSSSNGLTPDADLDSSLADAKQHVRDVITIIDILIKATSEADNTDTLDGQLVTSYTSDLTTARATLNNTLSVLTSAETSLANAREGLRRAEIGGTQNTEASLANAQVKQALGSLRSAQANYEKTVFRSPITGTVNNIRINTGDFISAFTAVAEIANNDALQISIYVSEQDMTQFNVGDTVSINNTTEGTVTSIAPAIDPITQKIEVKIGTESSELTNGSTVTITLKRDVATDTSETIRIPITAVKFSATDGSIFTIEDGVLKSRPVTIGTIIGSLVTIESGLDNNTEFVLDARGLSDGQRVEATRKK